MSTYNANIAEHTEAASEFTEIQILLAATPAATPTPPQGPNFLDDALNAATDLYLLTDWPTPV